MNWKGVIPAITTGFTEDLRVDHNFLAKHCRWLLDNGCSGIVALGSLGEGAALSSDEKAEILRTCVSAVGGRGPVVASISALTTSEAIAQAKAAAELGFDPAAAIVIGDKESDVEFGRRAGALTILIGIPGARPAPTPAPDYIVENLQQAADIIESRRA